MGLKKGGKFVRPFVLLFVLVLQQNVMASQATNMAQLKTQQHQQTATSQQHPHHVSAPMQQQQQQQQQSSIVSAHPGSSSGGSNPGHHHPSSQGLTTATLLSSAATGPQPSSSSSAAVAHLPTAQFVVNEKEDAVQEVLKHFSASANTDDDLNDSYQILNELKREVNAASGLPSQDQPPPPPPLSSMYPWNLFERPTYPTASPYNTMPIPTMSPLAGLFPHLFNPFESYPPSPFPVTPRFMPFMSYAQPILVPYPFYMAPEMYYSGFSAAPPTNDYEDSMSRGAGGARRPASSQSSGYSRNSPIYYVRLPPTPYMFLPSLTAATPAGYPTMMPYQSLPTFPSFSSVFNVPINFLANGKPGNVYQMGGPPTDVQNSYANIPTNFQNRPPPPPPSHATGNLGYRPTSSTHNYFNGAPSHSSSNHNYGSYAPSGLSTGQSASSVPVSAPQSFQDSKLTSLKRPYYFNGRPEDIYILPNNFNPLYSSENSYY